jgi:endonuclease-3
MDNRPIGVFDSGLGGLCALKELKKLLPPEESNDFCHRTVLHGRAVCTARRAYCENCVLKDICKKVNVK